MYALDSPVLSFNPELEEESFPWYIAVAASILGASAAHVAWVCSQCRYTYCNNVTNTVNAVSAWWGSAAGC